MKYSISKIEIFLEEIRTGLNNKEQIKIKIMQYFNSNEDYKSQMIKYIEDYPNQYLYLSDNDLKNLDSEFLNIAVNKVSKYNPILFLNSYEERYFFDKGAENSIVCLANKNYPIVIFINKKWSKKYKNHFINNISRNIEIYGINFFKNHYLGEIKECVVYRDIAESLSTSNAELYLEYFSKDFPEFINKSIFSIKK